MSLSLNDECTLISKNNGSINDSENHAKYWDNISGDNFEQVENFDGGF